MRINDKYIKQAEKEAIINNDMELLQNILILVTKYKIIY